jgi:hypothetical protein
MKIVFKAALLPPGTVLSLGNGERIALAVRNEPGEPPDPFRWHLTNGGRYSDASIDEERWLCLRFGFHVVQVEATR